MPEHGVKLETTSCPACKMGVVFDSDTQKFVTCTTCKGKGWIFRNEMCACGAPITTISADKLLYCGRDACLIDVRENHRDEELDKHIVSNSGGRYWPGYGGREFD